MKHNLILSLFAIIAWTLTGQSLAQITITSTHVMPFFTPGVTPPVYGASDSILNVGTASPSAQTWSFGTLTLVGTFQRQLLSPNQVPRGENFPQATAVGFHYDQAPLGDTCTHYEFYRLDSQALSRLGDVKVGPCDGEPDTIRFWYNIPPQRQLALPATYGTSWTSVDTTYDRDQIRITILNSSIDAFGTLVLPSGSYNSLRWKEDKVRLDYTGGVLTQTRRDITYNWLTTQGVLFIVRLKDTNQTSGVVPVEGVVYFLSTPSSVEYRVGMVPNEYILRQNFPNPFNPSTTIEFSLPQKDFVTLKVFNLLGEQVATLVSQNLSAGTYSAVWDASTAPSGVYYYQLHAGSFVETKKLILLR